MIGAQAKDGGKDRAFARGGQRHHRRPMVATHLLELHRHERVSADVEYQQVEIQLGSGLKDNCSIRPAPGRWRSSSLQVDDLIVRSLTYQITDSGEQTNERSN